MKEIAAIIAAYHQIDFAKTKAALATVVRVEGSSYRREGARMLITSDGQWTGGISGGCLEGDALRKAQQVIFQQQPRVVTYDTTQDDPFQIGVGLGCRGIIDILIEPIEPEDAFNPIHFLQKCQGLRENCAFAVMVQAENGKASAGRRYFLTDSGEEFYRDSKDDFITECQSLSKETLRQGFSALFSLANGGKVFVELIKPAIHLLVFGSNYDVLPLLEIASVQGWKLTVIGNLKKFGKHVFGLAGEVLPGNSNWLSTIHLDAFTVAILMAHDYKTDFINLKKLLPTPVPYIGMLGPKKRQQRIFDELEKEGIILSAEDENRIFGPAGLDIGATAPEGIALSIAAEILACFGRRDGGFLRQRDTPIYDPKPAIAHVK